MDYSISDQLRMIAETAVSREEAKKLIQGAEAVESLSSHVGALMGYILERHSDLLVPDVVIDAGRAIMNLQMGEPLQGANS